MTKVCKPITISDCPPVNTCDACVEVIKSDCVQYGEGNLTQTLTQITNNEYELTCEELGNFPLSCLQDIAINNPTEGQVLIYDQVSEGVFQWVNQNFPIVIPQACVKFKYKEICVEKGYGTPCPAGLHFDEAFSCSATVLPSGCVKSYKVFDWYGIEFKSFASIALFNTYFETPTNWEGLGGDIKLNYGYALVEYITCADGSSESTSACFESVVKDTSPSPMVVQAVPRTLASCRCCPDSLPE